MDTTQALRPKVPVLDMESGLTLFPKPLPRCGLQAPQKPGMGFDDHQAYGPHFCGQSWGLCFIQICVRRRMTHLPGLAGVFPRQLGALGAQWGR